DPGGDPELSARVSGAILGSATGYRPVPEPSPAGPLQPRLRPADGGYGRLRPRADGRYRPRRTVRDAKYQLPSGENAVRAERPGGRVQKYDHGPERRRVPARNHAHRPRPPWSPAAGRAARRRGNI